MGLTSVLCIYVTVVWFGFMGLLTMGPGTVFEPFTGFWYPLAHIVLPFPALIQGEVLHLTAT